MRGSLTDSKVMKTPRLIGVLTGVALYDLFLESWTQFQSRSGGSPSPPEPHNTQQFSDTNRVYENSAQF